MRPGKLSTYVSTVFVWSRSSAPPVRRKLISQSAGNESKGEHPWPLENPAFYTGQNGFLASLKTKGVMDETYWQALHFCQTASRERGIDAVLAVGLDGRKLNALLVPPDVGQTYEIAAQAGYLVLTIPVGVSSSTGMSFGLALARRCIGQVGVSDGGCANQQQYAVQADIAKVVWSSRAEHSCSG